LVPHGFEHFRITSDWTDSEKLQSNAPQVKSIDLTNKLGHVWLRTVCFS